MSDNLKEYLFRVIMGKEQGFDAEILRFVLMMASAVYTTAVTLLALLYRKGWLKPFECSRKVISIGNLTVGGSGKTPLAIYVVKHLLKSGRNPAIVTRGYMSAPGQASDEVLMLQELLPDVPVLAGADKLASLQSERGNVYLLDDGFQDWRIKRNLDIVVVDVENPFGNGWLLPRGIMREPLNALKRADLVVLTHVDTARENIQDVLGVVEEWAHKAMVIHTKHEVVGLSGFPDREVKKSPEDLRDKVCILSAIGSPASLRKNVENLGGTVAAELNFLDHHVYVREDIDKLVQACRQLNITKIVTTHKDAVKLVSFCQQLLGLTVYVLDIELRILHGENEFLSSIDRVLNS